MKLGVILCVLSLGSVALADTKTAGSPTMKPFEDNGLTLTGAEYWPYVGIKEPDYPKEVLWGFYPEQGVVAPGEDDPNVATASPKAIACAHKAYAKLRHFVSNKPAKFARVIELGKDRGVTPKFYLWTNDYTKAKDPFPGGRRKARLWYWMRKPQVEGKTPGYWKWESVVTQQGECQIPDDKQIADYIDEKLKELETHK
jgi:hypothetical protein